MNPLSLTQEFRSTLFYNIVSLQSFMHRSLKVPPQHFNQFDAWTLKRSFPNIVPFLFQPFCRFASVLGVIVLLHDPILANWWPHIWLWSTWYRGVHSGKNYCAMPRCYVYKNKLKTPHHHHRADSWYNMFVMICYVWFSLRITTVYKSSLWKIQSQWILQYNVTNTNAYLWWFSTRGRQRKEKQTNQQKI